MSNNSSTSTKQRPARSSSFNGDDSDDDDDDGNGGRLFAGTKELPFANEGWYRELFGYLCRCTCLSIFALIVAYYLYSLILRATSPIDLNTTCFVVDMFEHHVPGHRVRHPERPPLAIGEFCVNHQQLIVWWNVHEGFSRHFHLTDFNLHGPLPLERGRPQHAPVALALGLHAATRKARQSFKLSGTHVLDRELCLQILMNPELFYVAFEGVPNDADGGQRIEVARSKLDKQMKR